MPGMRPSLSSSESTAKPRAVGRTGPARGFSCSTDQNTQVAHDPDPVLEELESRIQMRNSITCQMNLTEFMARQNKPGAVIWLEFLSRSDCAGKSKWQFFRGYRSGCSICRADVDEVAGVHCDCGAHASDRHRRTPQFSPLSMPSCFVRCRSKTPQDSSC